MEKILRVNMAGKGGPEYKIEDIPEKYAGLGGRAMTTAVLYNEVDPMCHPLGKKNKLVIAPGLLSGTAAAMSGRISIGCKSPLTGGIKESNSGGQPAQVLARLGYAGIIIEGKPDQDATYVMHINSEGVSINEDKKLKMLPNYDLVEKLKKQYDVK